ncbi:hypothetical protein [Granulicella arctica]|uniref:hypothetical protein n=1 Tax=Granulicella arctica TaxID=940613 RepID=UPI0021E089B0|nr:hypothetical protein [Granulicella arctica]
MTDFESQILSDLSVLKSQMQSLIGIGQPGRLNQLEERVARHEQAVQRMRGLVAAFGGVTTMLHLTISYFSGRR